MKYENKYLEQVYASVLGKVIGVYMGRPFEGWWKDHILRVLGPVEGYIYEKCKKPLIVSDDDISGTFTFIRALEDSGLYENTPDDFFGEMWKNYILENQSILWWGGMSVSTENTAFLRLKQGYKSPESGSIALNGKIVAEQIGAQIFIDAFGMVAPGKPELAAKLARASARVSHDGAAVDAAVVQAVLVSLAFEEKNMDCLLDRAIKFIPEDSIIAEIHKDVRQWSREDGDWEKTYARIFEKYGYDKFGGGCHIVPNHAIMVMAWCYAPDNFHKAMTIINTAGWDTDCNAANVGAVMGLVVGLDGICKDYDYRGPVADRVVVPTSEGTYGVTSCLEIAKLVARIGSKIMGYNPVSEKEKYTFSFGSQEGFVPHNLGKYENTTISIKCNDGFIDACASEPSGGAIAVGVSHEYTLRSEFPQGGYGVTSTPQAYSGNTIEFDVENVSAEKISARIFSGTDRIHQNTNEPLICYSEGAEELFAPGERRKIKWVIDTPDDIPLSYMGIALVNQGTLRIHSANIYGESNISIVNDTIPAREERQVNGWICSANIIRWRNIISSCDGPAVLVTGNQYWRNASAEAEIFLRGSDFAGVIFDYKGLNNFSAVGIGHGKLTVYRIYFGKKEELYTQAAPDLNNESYHANVSCKDKKLFVKMDDFAEFSLDVPYVTGGAMGTVVENGSIILRSLKIAANMVR